MSPWRYSIQGEAHPFLETVNNRQENSKYFYGGVAELVFEVSDSVKNPEQITAGIYSTIFSIIENPELLTPDLMGMALDGWEFIWESSDEEFYSASGRGFMEIATAITGANPAKCLDEFAESALKHRLRSGKLIATSGSTEVVEEVTESVVKGGTSAKGLIGHDFEDYLSKTIGGEGSFSVGGES